MLSRHWLRPFIPCIEAPGHNAQIYDSLSCKMNELRPMRASSNVAILLAATAVMPFAVANAQQARLEQTVAGAYAGSTFEV